MGRRQEIRLHRSHNRKPLCQHITAENSPQNELVIEEEMTACLSVEDVP